MSITYKFLLNKRRVNAEGQYPLVLRLYQQGLYKEYSLNMLVREPFWDSTNQTVLGAGSEVANEKIISLKIRIKKLLL
jgi:hypothetical protein